MGHTFWSAAAMFIGVGLSPALGANEPGLAKPNLLFIGDSHAVGTFGKVEDSLLRRLRTYSVATYGSCGSSPDWWALGKPTNCGYFWKTPAGVEERGLAADTPLISDLLGQYKPTFTIIEQGANLFSAPLDYAVTTSRQLAETVTGSGSQCIWIGPPNGRNKPEPALGTLWDSISAAVAPLCQMIDSRPYTYYPATGGDGAHFDSLGPLGVQIATDWANAVFREYADRLESLDSFYGHGAGHFAGRRP